MKAKQASKVLYDCDDCGTCAQFLHLTTLVERRDNIQCWIACNCGKAVTIPIRNIDNLGRLLLQNVKFKALAA